MNEKKSHENYDSMHMSLHFLHYTQRTFDVKGYNFDNEFQATQFMFYELNFVRIIKILIEEALLTRNKKFDTVVLLIFFRKFMITIK